MSYFNYLYVTSDKPYTRCNEACTSVCLDVCVTRKHPHTHKHTHRASAWRRHWPAVPHPNYPPPVTRQPSPGLHTLYEIIPMQTLALRLPWQPSTAQWVCAAECVRACPCCGCAHVGLCLSAISFNFFSGLSQVKLQQKERTGMHLKSRGCKDLYIEEST